MIFADGRNSSLHSIGRLVAHFVQRSVFAQQYTIAARQRADLQTVQSGESGLTSHSHRHLG